MITLLCMKILNLESIFFSNGCRQIKNQEGGLLLLILTVWFDPWSSGPPYAIRIQPAVKPELPMQ